jgi:hypothetical protein
MLYNKSHKRNPAFLESVDNMFDQIIGQPPRLHLSPLQDLIEYRTLYLSLPRQTGKSQYIGEVSKMFSNPLIFTPTRRMGEDLFGKHTDGLISVSSLIRNPDLLRGMRHKADVFFFDEVHYDDAIKTLQLFDSITQGISRRCVVLGLKT